MQVDKCARFLLISALAWVVGCDGGKTSDVSDGGGVVLAGQKLALSFEALGPIATTANVPTSLTSSVRLFEGTAREAPPSALMGLPCSSVAIGSYLSTSDSETTRTASLGGTAVVRLTVTPSGSSPPGIGAIPFAEFLVGVVMGTATIEKEEYELSQQAIAALSSGEVTFGIDITADFDGKISLGKYYLAFGGGQAGPLPQNTVPGEVFTPNGWKQVPIDNDEGRATVSPVNRTIGGVAYSVVGVLESQTAAVVSLPGEPSTVSVVQEELGLSNVVALYMAVHGSFIPDVPDGVTLATLTVSYADLGTPETLDFVVGENTAEWSYGRPEHISEIGGVKHLKAPVLFDFETSIDSLSQYTGYSYSAVLRVDPTRRISTISMSMTDPATYSGLRALTGERALLADHAIMAMTLVGGAVAAPSTQACCFEDRSCGDFTPQVCLLKQGETVGPYSACAATTCPGGGTGGDDGTDGTGEDDGTGGDDGTDGQGSRAPEACCLPPMYAYEWYPPYDTYEPACGEIGREQYLRDRESCTFFNGVLMGAGTSCDTVDCWGIDFLACCGLLPSDPDGCRELLYDACLDKGGDPQPSGVHCDDLPCMSSDTDTDADTDTDTDTDMDIDTDADTDADTDTDTDTDMDTDTDADTDALLGGCCFDDTVYCFDGLSEADCIAGGGEPHGSCEPDPCLFACCLPDGSCSDYMSMEDCDDQEGVSHPRGTPCSDVSCVQPTKWVRVETVINANNELTEFYAGETPNWYEVPRYEGKYDVFSLSATRFSLDSRHVEYGEEHYNMTLTTTFDEPPSELIPGQTIALTVNAAHSGTSASPVPGLQFCYGSREVSLDVNDVLAYFPWSADFSGIDTKTYSFEVPSTSGTTLTIGASWWNCPCCNVSWVYEERTQ